MIEQQTLIYKDDDDTSPTYMPRRRGKYTVTEPDYYNDIVDPEAAAKLAEIQELVAA